MKVDLEIVEETLRGYKQLGQAEVSQLVESIKTEAEARKPPKETRPKRPHVILVSDPDGKLVGEFTGWVFQVEPEDEFKPVYPRLCAAAAEFNVSRKGRRSPVSTVGETIMHVSPKFLKAQGLLRKHKEPAFIQRTVNALPATDVPQEEG